MLHIEIIDAITPIYDSLETDEERVQFWLAVVDLQYIAKSILDTPKERWANIKRNPKKSKRENLNDAKA
jgi:NAD(P)H-nitrite reductase large subunit